MDQNNKNLLQFHQLAAGLQNANVLLSQLQQGLSANILPTGLPAGLGSDLGTSWATQQGQSWMDPAKMAAMLPVQNLFFNPVKQLDQLQANALTSATSSIFPSQFVNLGASTSKDIIGSTQSPAEHSNPASAKSSTPHDVDVSGTSRPGSQMQVGSVEAADGSNTWSLLNVPSTSKSSISHAAHLMSERSSSSDKIEIRSPAKNCVGQFKRAKSTDLNLTRNNEHLDDLDSISDLLFASSTRKNDQIPSTSTASTTENNDDNKKNTSGDMLDEDKDFDLLDMVTERGNQKDQSFGYEIPGVDQGAMSPEQFTGFSPPDSPRAADEPADNFTFVSSARPTPTPTPLLPCSSPFLPLRSETPNFKVNETFKSPMPPPAQKKELLWTKPVQKVNKIPIYKQKKMAAPVIEKPTKKTGGCDAYSFEEEEVPLSKIDPREKLDAEVREKLSKMAAQTADTKSKNIYVPGVGFAVPPEQSKGNDLWRHVVPKKRPMGENRPIIPAANLLPSSVHAEACQAAARLAEPEILSLAESIRRRKRDRYNCMFVKSEQTPSVDCVREEKKVCSDKQPRLPKLVIRLPKRISEDVPAPRKRSRRGRYDDSDDDSDWESRHVYHRRKSRRSQEMVVTGYECRIVERENEVKRSQVRASGEMDASLLSKKRRLMMQWQGAEQPPDVAATATDVKTNGVKSPVKPLRPHAEFNTAAVKSRLSKFGPAEGLLPKGTFVVAKADLFRDDCALWRVDNQNLLQKYPPKYDPTTKCVYYRNSSTYSGWCEQIASGYYRVSTKVIRQNRSEALIEPEIPLTDLFPAMTEQCTDNNGFIKIDEDAGSMGDDQIAMLRDPLRLSLHTYIQAMVEHALTLEYLQSQKEKNDWTFLRAVTELEKANADCMTKLQLKAKFSERIVEYLKQYTQLNISDCDWKEVQCQSCVMRSVDKVVQLFAKYDYEPESLQTVDKKFDTEQPPLPSIDILVCSICASACQGYHRCYHMKYHLLKRCEDRLELLGTAHPDFSPERIVDIAKKGKTWIHSILNEYMEIWRKSQADEITSQSTN